jgi:DNA-binding transcriptional ArsR family regulator
VTYVSAEIDTAALGRMAKAMSHPLRIRILAELNNRVMSPTLFFNECNVEGHSLSTIAKHFRKLVKYGYLEVIEQKSGDVRRGGVETFYRATKRTVFDESSWPSIPDALKNTVTAEVFRAFAERVKKAIEAGTIDARDDRHFTWTGFLLDRRGWDELIQSVDGLFYTAFEIADAADRRIRETGEEPIHATLSLAAFESPTDSTKAP